MGSATPDPRPQSFSAAAGTPDRRLQAILDLFPGSPLAEAGLEPVEAGLVPDPYRRLLLHHHHMTVTLEEHHGARVTLRVLERKRRGDDYGRHLILTAGSSPRAVMWGMMRIQLGHTSPGVRAAILAEDTPLGRILIEHDVMRRLETQLFVKVHLNEALEQVFQAPGEPVTYGRVARIFCDGAPAVELLEVVRPEPR